MKPQVPITFLKQKALMIVILLLLFLSSSIFAQTTCNKINASIRDAEEEGGTVELTSEDLDFEDKYIGLQFSGFIIPEDATIVGAYIKFVARDYNEGTVVTIIDAEDDNTPANFTTSTNNLSGRALIGEEPVEWNIETWEENETYQTPDISAIVYYLQTLYNGFETNDVLSFILTRDEENNPAIERTSYSWNSDDGNSPNAPELCISYVLGIGGEIVTRCSQSPMPVPGITVEITPTGDDPCLLEEYDTTPDSEGNYQQTLCGETAEYEVVPQKTDDPLCGLTMMDVVLIRNHANYCNNNPDEDCIAEYIKRIGADMDFDGDIDVYDWARVYKAILEIVTLSKPWVFVEVGSEEEQGSVPYVDPPTFNESIIDDFPRAEKANFFIQKMGDIDCDCTPGTWVSPIPTPAPQKVNLAFNDTHLNEDDFVNIAFKADNFTDLMAYQIGIGFDHESLEYISTASGDLNGAGAVSHFGLTDVSEGKIRVGWIYESSDTIIIDTTLTDGSSTFIIRFQALENIASLQDEIWLDDGILPNLAFESEGTVHGFDLNSVDPMERSVEDEFTKELITNVKCYPNPAADELNFRIDLKEDSKTQILIFDQLGRSIVNEEMNLSMGEQLIKFNHLNSWANGLYYYTVKTNDSVFSGTFIKAANR